MADAQPLFRFRSRWQIGMRYSGLPPHTRLVALALASWMRADGGGVHPGSASLQEATGLSRSAVFRALAHLEAAGWIRRAGGGGRGRSATIVPTIPAAIEQRIEEVLAGRERSQERDGIDPETVPGAGPFDPKPSRSEVETVPLAGLNRPTGGTLALPEPNEPDGRPIGAPTGQPANRPAAETVSGSGESHDPGELRWPWTLIGISLAGWIAMSVDERAGALRAAGASEGEVARWLDPVEADDLGEAAHG